VRPDETDLPARVSPLTIAVLVGLAARLLLVATSIGTNDVPFMLLWAKYARESGIAGAYARQWELNHPPLSLLIIHWLDLLAARTGIEFTDLLRLLQVAADMVTTAALAAIVRIRSVTPHPAILFVVCPAAIAISGFHCNTDPTMVALMVASILLLLRGRGFAAGLTFAAAVGIKIIPLLVLPFILMRRESRLRFATACAIGLTAIFAPAIAAGGPAVLRNVFGYSGFAGKWGFPALLLTVESWIAQPRTTVLFQFASWYADNGRYIIAAAVIGLLVLLWRRSDALLAAVPTVLLFVLTLAPGFGIQYLLWPLPLLPWALGRRMLLILYTAISVYVLMTYTIWSRGFPWWYADSVSPSPGKPLVTTLGLIVWSIIAVSAVNSLRRLMRAEA
jgi:uncharacterized membrane protein